MNVNARVIPDEEEVLTWFETLSNWGRWGAEDSLGTLNLITNEKRIAASRLVEEGVALSLAWDIDTDVQPEQTHGAPQRLFYSTGAGLEDDARVLAPGLRPGDRQAGALEFIGMVFHGFSVTHLDGLSHVFWDQKMYNGLPAEMVSSSHGATAHDITAVRGGILTRGVLVDAPRFRGVDWLEPGDSVTGDELREILVDQQIEVEEGDALLLRTGYGRRKIQNGPDNVSEAGRAGWHASTMPVLHELGVSVIGADTAQDVIPSGYENVRIPVHTLGLVAMGLYMIDNLNLESLSEKCNTADRFEFQFVATTLPFIGATGCPVNPLAVF